MLVIIFIAGAGDIIAQTRSVSGKVLDETGASLPGASVAVFGTTIGTVTDVDGNFRLDVPNENNVLQVRALSYNEQQINIPASNVVTVNMALAAQELESVVVTALAVRREKREIGYSATTLNSDELNNANNVNPLSALQGKVSGANITSSTGGPGGSTRVVLRGEKSITGNNNALIVVDGVPINNSSRLAGNRWMKYCFILAFPLINDPLALILKVVPSLHIFKSSVSGFRHDTSHFPGMSKKNDAQVSQFYEQCLVYHELHLWYRSKTIISCIYFIRRGTFIATLSGLVSSCYTGPHTASAIHIS